MKLTQRIIFLIGIKMKQNKSIKLNFGFTLAELLVAMSLFIIFISIATAGFISALKNQRIAVALMAANDSVSLSLEQMAREMRTGIGFRVINSGQIEFLNAERNIVSYRLNANNGTIERGVEKTVVGNYDFKPITADNVRIDKFIIRACGKNKRDIPPSINGNNSLDNCSGSADNNFPPRISLFLSITSKDKDVEKLNIFTNIQTTISAREIQ